MTQLAPSMRFREVLHAARLRQATDVHLAVDARPVFRVDGELDLGDGSSFTGGDIEEILSQCLDAHAKSRLENTGDVTVSYEDVEIGAFRIHAYSRCGARALAIRVLAKTIPALETLFLPPAVSAFAERQHGLVIFAGPTGSGKSTALASVVDRVNRLQAKHIITIEDPVEYRHVSQRSIISQRQIGTDVSTFAGAIKGALRSDPDVILVGEMRDRATMSGALIAAETGHLVFATLHTGNAPETIDRVVGSFRGEAQIQIRIQLAQVLVGVVCLRLLPRANGTGRTCAAEILIVNDAVRSVIRDAKSHQIRNIIATGRLAGMQTLEAHLSELASNGEITYESASRATDRPSDIHAPVSLAG